MGGVDHYDWSILGGNPTPGDPDVIRSIAGKLRDLSDGVANQNRLLRSVGGDSESIWTGPAADAFRPHLAKLPGQMDKLITSYRDAAEALDGYWPRLAAAQHTAVQALFKAQTAQADVRSAQVQVSTAGHAASSAADAYNTAATAAATAPPDPTGAMTSHVANLQTAYQTASNQLAAANSALAAANSSLQAARSMAESARTQAKASAGHAAAVLHEASNAGIHNPHHSWFSSIVDDVEGVFDDGVHWVEHHAGDIAFAASLALGPLGMLITPEGRHLLSEGLHAIEPGLKVLSGVLGVTSGILAVAGLVLAPVGLGEVIDLANEGVMALKTADDAALVVAGDSEAEAALVEDGVGLATGGLGRVFGDMGEGALATGEAGEAAAASSEASEAVDSAVSALSGATGRMVSASEDVARTGSDAELLNNLAADATAEGRTLDANSFAAQAEAKLQEQASSLQSLRSASESAADARGGVDHALSEQDGALRNLQDAKDRLANVQPYAVRDLPSGLKSFAGGTNLSRFQDLRTNVQEFRSIPRGVSEFAHSQGLGDGYVKGLAQVYGKDLIGTPNFAGRTGALLHTFSVGINVHEAYNGVTSMPEHAHQAVSPQ